MPPVFPFKLRPFFTFSFLNLLSGIMFRHVFAGQCESVKRLNVVKGNVFKKRKRDCVSRRSYIVLLLRLKISNFAKFKTRVWRETIMRSSNVTLFPNNSLEKHIKRRWRNLLIPIFSKEIFAFLGFFAWGEKKSEKRNNKNCFFMAFDAVLSDSSVQRDGVTCFIVLASFSSSEPKIISPLQWKNTKPLHDLSERRTKELRRKKKKNL